ncbi:MAG: HEAT repeat domain-containing protein, partial [Bacteroidota bacterium]
KQSLHRAGVEMLFLPLDGEVKGRIKTYIDVLIDSVAGGVGGLLLLLLINGLNVSPVGISPVVFVFALLWLICVLMIREEYLDAFRNKLRHLRPKAQKNSLRSRHKEVLAGFLRVLEEGHLDEEDSQLLYVLERTEDLRDVKFHSPIKKLLRHASPAVRARALSALSLNQGPDLFEEVIPLLEDEHVRVSNAALEYLITHHLEGSEILIQERLEHPSAEIAGTALVQLLQETRGNPTLRERWGLNAFFAAKVRELGELAPAATEEWTIKLLAAAGRSGTELGNEFIARHLRAAPAKVVHAAIVAAGESREGRWIFPLIDFLSEPEMRPYAASVLVEYGAKLLRVLPRYLKENSVDVEDWRRMPKVLERIPSMRTVDFLFALLKSRFTNDLELRLEILKALNALRRDDPDLSLPRKTIVRQIKVEARAYDVVIRNLHTQTQLIDVGNENELAARKGLITLLRKRRDGNLNRLLRLLGLRYPPADIIPIYRGLISRNERERNSALEFLDNLLEPQLKVLIVPSLEFGLRSWKERPGKGNPQPFLRAQAGEFQAILKGRDVRQKMAVLYLMSCGDDPAFSTLAQRFRGDKDKRLRDLARRVGVVELP